MAFKKIYTHSEAAKVVDMFEEILDRYDIVVPSPEDDDRGDDNEAKLYGSVYSELLDNIEDTLVTLLKGKTRTTELVIDVFGETK